MSIKELKYNHITNESEIITSIERDSIVVDNLDGGKKAHRTNTTRQHDEIVFISSRAEPKTYANKPFVVHKFLEAENSV